MLNQRWGGFPYHQAKTGSVFPVHPSPNRQAPAGLINTLGLSSGRNTSGIGVDNTIPGDLLIPFWGERESGVFDTLRSVNKGLLDI